MATVTDFVPADESLLVRWEGRLRGRSNSEDVVLGTTDQSVVFCSETGTLGVFPRDHVSSVESWVETRAEYDLEDYRLFVGGGALLSVATFVGAVLSSSGWLALVLLLVAVGGLWVVEHGWRNREVYGTFERSESAVETVVLHTDAGVRREFQFTDGNRAGAQLSRFLQAT